MPAIGSRTHIDPRSRYVALNAAVATQEDVVRGMQPARSEAWARIQQVEMQPHQLRFMVNEQLNITYCSKYTCMLLGYRHDDILELHAQEVLRPNEDVVARYPEHRRVFLEARAHPGEEFTLDGADGGLFVQAADKHRVRILSARITWSVHSKAWMIVCVLPPEEDARYRQLHPGAQFPDPLDALHMSDYMTVYRRLQAAKAPQTRQRSKTSYLPEEFAPAIREALRWVSDPENLARRHGRVTVPAVLRRLDYCDTRNTLDSLLSDYGYKRPGETVSRTLIRLAHEWFPQWWD